MIGDYCREYRIKKGVTLKELTGGKQIKTLSAFEMGRSTNIHHLEPYIKLSSKHNDENVFMDGLLIAIREGLNGSSN